MDTRTDTAEKLLQMSFLFHNKMMRPVFLNVRPDLSPLQVHVLHTLQDKGTATMSLLANEIYISKQQTTRVIDQLVLQNFVHRDFDAQDRRIIKISLTPAGEAILKNIKKEAHDHVIDRLASLDEKIIAEFNEAAGKLTRLLKELP